MAVLRCWIPDTLREDKDAIEKFEKQAIAMAEARRCPVHLRVLHNGRVVHSKSYGNADTREF